MDGTDAGALDAGIDDAATSTDAGPRQIRSLTAGPYSAARGVERTTCVSLDLGNDAPAMIREIRSRLTPGSHHMIIYRLDGAPDPTPRDCGAFEHGVADSLFIAQQTEAGLAYPDGAGLPIEAHQTVGVEVHYINYFSDAPVDVVGSVDFVLSDPDPSMREVALSFTGDLTLSIPPRSTTTETSFHRMPAGAEVFGLTSHTHELGTLATIHRGTSSAEPGELLHESRDWSEPPLDLFDPPLVLAEGDGLVLSCEFENNTDRHVGFGTGFSDEMCFLWAYYLR